MLFIFFVFFSEAKTAVSPEENIKLVSLPNEQKEYLVRYFLKN